LLAIILHTTQQEHVHVFPLVVVVLFFFFAIFIIIIIVRDTNQGVVTTVCIVIPLLLCLGQLHEVIAVELTKLSIQGLELSYYKILLKNIQ